MSRERSRRSVVWMAIGFSAVYWAVYQDQAFSENFARVNKDPQKIEIPSREPEQGEKLTFEVYWFGIPVGFGSLEVADKTVRYGKEVYHIIARARTNEFLSRIYSIEDEVHSYYDVQNTRSVEFRKTLKEGRYRADERIVFDYENGVAHYESFLNHGKKDIAIAGPSHDILSAFYWFRSQDVSPGTSVHARVNSEEQDWDLEVKILRRETKEFRDGRSAETLLVEPRTSFKGILYDRGKALIYFSVDKKRVPVWITLKTPFGPVYGVLKASDGEAKDLEKNRF